MKYIKSFADQTALNNYYDTCAIKKSYLFRNESGTDGIDYIGSGKKIQSGYKPSQGLTFTAQQANSTVKYNTGITNTTAEYSLDNLNWQNAVGVTVTLTNVGDKVYYRGTITGTISTSSTRFTMTGKIAASGSIMSMYNKNADDLVISYDKAFYYMFSGCTSLTTAPELTATTLATNCYNNMFRGCTSLTTAPELPATTLAGYCYYCMFQWCSSLNYVKHHITNWNTSNTIDWLSGVAATGTVECPTASTIPSNNTSGIPTGWTRQNF